MRWPDIAFVALCVAGPGALVWSVSSVIKEGGGIQARLESDLAKFLVERECVRDHYSPDYGVIYRCLDGVWSGRDIELHYLAKYKAGK